MGYEASARRDKERMRKDTLNISVHCYDKSTILRVSVSRHLAQIGSQLTTKLCRSCQDVHCFVAHALTAI